MKMFLPFSQKKGRLDCYGLKHELWRNLGIVVTGFVKVQIYKANVTEKSELWEPLFHDNVSMQNKLNGTCNIIISYIT